ncbi:hypothetical protein V5799_003601 [Amblyomma americanum]|uniref:Uncharacterized protein n=1 Tax=Amblyomma americanum TaxID=6943 RepID=A0AAQ4D8H9_AMBAM
MICLWAVMADRGAGRVEGNATSVSTVEINSSAESTTEIDRMTEADTPGTEPDPDMTLEDPETTETGEDTAASSEADGDVQPDSSTVTPGRRAAPDVAQRQSAHRVSVGDPTEPAEISGGA